MNEPYEVINYRGFNIKIYRDDDSPNPVVDWDMLSIMVCWHRRYTLGHVQPDCNPEEFLKQLAIGADPSIEDKIDYWENGPGWQMLSNKYYHVPELKSVITKTAPDEADRIIKSLIDKAIDKHYIMLPLYLYDHSGITIRTSPFSCPWDSGQLGFAYIAKSKLKEEFGKKIVSPWLRKKAIEIIQSDVKAYDQFLTGEVSGYMIEPADNNKSIECDDSCWGFYGDDHEASGLLESAKSSIDYAIKKYRESVLAEHAERIRMDQFMNCCWSY